ncbi:MAG TPA: VOC family protein [Steroidobacteraceae bacterium]|nr:VOC family protein [Steroidobacteraceae bacterium]
MNESPNDSHTTTAAAKEPTLKLKFLSHGTLESRDLDFTRRFYEEFLGFEVVRPSKISLWCRLGGQHIYVVVQVPEGKKGEMPMLNHNGIDVETEEEVDLCHRLVVRDAELWKLHKISKPIVQHGTYSFFFWDADDNSWEILANPPGGYSWMFERGDQPGMGHLSRNFARPESTRRKTPGA